jgi:hypothetical protein
MARTTNVYETGETLMQFTEEWMEKLDIEKLNEWHIKIHYDFIARARAELVNFNIGKAADILIEAENEMDYIHNSFRAFIQEHKPRDKN